MKLSEISRVYFIGIGGIGMSAIVRYFLHKGIPVSGYDKTSTNLTKQLEAEGAFIHYTDDVDLLDRKTSLVVFTPAIPVDHRELNWYRQNGFLVIKRSDILQIITADSFNICIAGTHGKTSISTMVGHLLRHTGFASTVFLGGISNNYQTNFWSQSNAVSVVEADEYDRSFLKLSPDIAVISAMDADHLDIYGTVEAMEDAFVMFAQRIKPGGLLIRKPHLHQLEPVHQPTNWNYQLNSEAGVNVFAENLTVHEGGYLFNAVVNGHRITSLSLRVGGLHNVENMLAAIAIAHRLGIDDELIVQAVTDYKGVRRRFEYIIEYGVYNHQPLVMIDDYAHHPEELRALITSAKNLFPNLRSTLVFQPHLYTRTRDLAPDFGAVLSLVDEVILLPIYPAREQPIEGVSAATIGQHVNGGKAKLLSKEEWLHYVQHHQPELLIMAGAGDIDLLIPETKKILLSK